MTHRNRAKALSFSEMASTKSFDSAQSAGRLLAGEIEKIKKYRMEYQGFKGYWVQESTLTRLETELKEISESGASASLTPAAIKELNDELQALRSQNATQKTILEASKANEANLTRDLAQLQASFEAKKKLSDKEKADLRTAQSKLRDELKALKAEAAKVKKEEKPGKDASDEVKAQYDAKVKALSEESQRLNSALEDVNKDLKSRTDELNRAFASVKRLEASLEAERDLQSRMSSKTFSEALKDEAPPPLRKLEPIPEPTSFTLKKAFSAKAMSFLEAYANKRREDIRDRAFQLMQFANETDPKNFVGYKAYAELIWHSIRRTGPKDRQKFDGVLDSLWESMVIKSGPPLKAVKEAYRDVFQKSEDEQAEEIEFSKGKETWWQSLKFDFWFYRKTTSVWYREQKEKIWGKMPENASIWRRLKAHCKTATTFVKSFFHWGSSVVKTD